MSGIKHAFVSGKPSGPDPTKVDGPKWDADHVVPPGTFLQASPQYGLGVDGALAFDGTTTVLGMAPSSGVYTLTRDIHATSITFTGGAKLKLANWRLFCQGAITGQGHATTIISNDGNSAVGKVAGQATPAGYYAATFTGGIGLTGTGTGNIPVAYANNVAPPIYAASGTTAGAGAAGSAAAGGSGTKYGEPGAGGAGASSSAGFSGGNSGGVNPAAASNGYGPAELASGRGSSGSTQYALGHGGGGGGGFAQSGTTPGDTGAGGASAGKAFVAAQSITGVTVSAKGGNGGNATVASGGTPIGGWGGGGGGPGGEAIVTYSTCSDLYCDVTGGAGGAGAQIGSGGIAGAGGSGYKGRVFYYNLAGDGTVPTIVP